MQITKHVRVALNISFPCQQNDGMKNRNKTKSIQIYPLHLFTPMFNKRKKEKNFYFCN